jgi:hypothetical protein
MPFLLFYFILLGHIEIVGKLSPPLTDCAVRRVLIHLQSENTALKVFRPPAIGS